MDVLGCIGSSPAKNPAHAHKSEEKVNVYFIVMLFVYICLEIENLLPLNL